MQKLIASAFVAAIAVAAPQFAKAQYIKPSQGTFGAVPAPKTYAPPTFGAPPARPAQPAPSNRSQFAPMAPIGGPTQKPFKPYGGYGPGGEWRRPPGLIDPNNKAYHPYAD